MLRYGFIILVSALLLAGFTNAQAEKAWWQISYETFLTEPLPPGYRLQTVEIRLTERFIAPQVGHLNYRGEPKAVDIWGGMVVATFIAAEGDRGRPRIQRTLLTPDEHGRLVPAMAFPVYPDGVREADGATNKFLEWGIEYNPYLGVHLYLLDVQAGRADFPAYRGPFDNIEFAGEHLPIMVYADDAPVGAPAFEATLMQGMQQINLDYLQEARREICDCVNGTATGPAPATGLTTTPAASCFKVGESARISGNFIP